MQVPRLEPARLPQLRGGASSRCREGSRWSSVPTAPARPTCSRPPTSAAPRLAAHVERARARAPRRDRRARGDRDARRRGDPQDRGRLPARRGQAPARRWAPSRACATRGAPARSVFLPERLDLVKGARRSPGPPRPVGRRPLARPRGHARGVLACARATQRAARSRPCRRLRADCLDAWDAELARDGIALMEDRAGAVEGLQAFAARGAARAARDGRAALPAALGRRPTPRAAAELAERRSADLQRGFTAHGPHRDELLLAETGRRCVPTGRRVSSAPPCSRCCSPSASCWPSAATRRR